MRKFFIICIFIFTSGLANAEMVSSDSIGNDPGKEKLCAKRAGGKPVPFVIDSNYVERARSTHPDATFISIGGQLIECELREGTGRFEPDSMSPEQEFWHLPRPEMYDANITGIGRDDMVYKVCTEAIEAAEVKQTRLEFDHRVFMGGIIENGTSTPVAGKHSKQYDVLLMGKSFFKSSKPDLIAYNFSCLLTPMLALKAFEFKKESLHH